MSHINIRLSTTDGHELYPDDYVLTTDKSVTADEVEHFIQTFKEENEDYQTSDVAEAIAEQFNGKMECVTFSPKVDVVI